MVLAWRSAACETVRVAMKTGPKTITVTEFKAKCPQLLDGLDPVGLVITKRGRPVARVVPFVDNSKLIGSMKDKIKILGDIFSTGEKWEAES
jgi:prevent-host-death family protein